MDDQVTAIISKIENTATLIESITATSNNIATISSISSNDFEPIVKTPSGFTMFKPINDGQSEDGGYMNNFVSVINRPRVTPVAPSCGNTCR